MVCQSVCADSTPDLLNMKLLPEALYFVSRSGLKTSISHRSVLGFFFFFFFGFIVWTLKTETLKGTVGLG